MNKSTPDTDTLLGVPGASDVAGMSLSWTRKRFNERGTNGLSKYTVRLGRAVRVTRSGWLEWLLDHREEKSEAARAASRR